MGLVRQKALELIDIVYETIEEFPNGVPSGHLYTHLMTILDIDSYNAIISILVKSGKITCTNHLLRKA